jgi:hypothetical protein
MSNYFGSGLEPVKYGYAPLGYTDSAYAAAPAVTLYNPTIDTPSYYILPYALSANAGPVGHDGGADDAVPSAPLNLADYPLLPYGPPPLF